MVLRRSRLKDGREFKWPWILRESPLRMRAQHAGGLLMIWLKIGAEIKAGVRRSVPRRRRNDRALYHPVFVVPKLWPRVRKQNEDAAEFHVRRQRLEKQTRLSAEKKKIGQIGAGAFAQSAFDPVA